MRNALLHARSLMPPLLGALVVLTAQPAAAHLMPPGRATVHALGSSVYSVVSIPASALGAADDDGDGLLGEGELARHQEELSRALGDRWRLRDGEARAETVRVDLVPQPPDGAPAPADNRADQVVMLHHGRFPHPPRQLEVETDLFGTTAATASLTVGASRDKQSESATLSPGEPRHLFFAAASPPATRRWPQALLVGLIPLAAIVRRRSRRNLDSTRTTETEIK